MLSRLYTIPGHDRQVDRIGIAISRVSIAVLSRDKNAVERHCFTICTTIAMYIFCSVSDHTCSSVHDAALSVASPQSLQPHQCADAVVTESVSRTVPLLILRFFN